MEHSVPPVHARAVLFRVSAIALAAVVCGLWLKTSPFSVVLLVIVLAAGPGRLAAYSVIWALALAGIRLPFALWLGETPIPFAAVYLAGEAVLVLLPAGRLPRYGGEYGTDAGGWRKTFLGYSAVGALFALLLRNVAVYESLGWAFVCVLAAGGPESVLRSLKETAGKTIGNLLLVAFSVCLCFAIAEVGLRAKYQWLPPYLSLFEEDPQYHVMMRPGAKISRNIRVRPEERRYVTYEISQQGLRDVEYGPKSSDEYRILMLGDSFTMGTPVAPPDTIPKQMEQMFREANTGKRISVINAGSVGAGPLQELGMLRTRGLALEPDLVILQLFLPNDVHNVLWDIGELLPVYDLKPQIALETWRLRGVFPFSLEVWLRAHSRLYSELIPLLPGGCRPMVGLFQGLRWPPSETTPELPAREERHFGLELSLKEWYPELRKGVDLMMNHIRSIRDECRARGIDLIVYCIPGASEVDGAAWENLTRPYPGKYDRFGSIRRIDALLREQKIMTASVREPLECEMDTDKIYFPLDGHLTEYGNQLVARCLSEFLLRGYFPVKGFAVSANAGTAP